MNSDELDRGAALLAAATPGPWEVWTSNSYRRITRQGGQDGGVLHGYAQNDGHGDLGGRNWEADLALIVWARNNLPGLLAAARQAQDNAKDAELLRDCKIAMDDWLHSYAAEMCDSIKVDETYARIMEGGGTLAYIAKLTDRLRAAIDSARDKAGA